MSQNAHTMQTLFLCTAIVLSPSSLLFISFVVDHILQLCLFSTGGVGCHVGPLEEQCVVEAHGEDWDGATVLEVHHLVGVD